MRCVRSLVFIAFILIHDFAEASIFKSCTSTDQECMDSNVNAVYQQLITGIPSLGIETHDPLYQSYIEGDISILKYKYFNSTFHGFSKCKISNVKMNKQTLNLQFVMSCPQIDFSGKYEINGRLIVLPVEGKGDYEIITGNYKLEIDCELKIIDGSDGEKHLHVKNYKIKSTALAPMRFNFMNLFNGQKDLTDAVLKFADENWKEVADFVQDPVWYAQAKKFFSSANKYLDTVPLKDVIPK